MSTTNVVGADEGGRATAACAYSKMRGLPTADSRCLKKNDTPTGPSPDVMAAVLSPYPTGRYAGSDTGNGAREIATEGDTFCWEIPAAVLACHPRGSGSPRTGNDAATAISRLRERFVSRQRFVCAAWIASARPES